MSAPIPGVIATPTHGSAGSRPSTSSSASGRTRSRQDMDIDSDDNEADTAGTSPHPAKVPRTSIDSDASTSSSSPNATHQKQGEVPDSSTSSEDPHAVDPVNDMAQALLDELECGMCAGVYIEPLALNGCGHVFCGSCVQQWIKSIPTYPATILPGDKMPEPISCPQCRHAPVQTATPSRVAKTMVNFLLERYPAAARAPDEIKQAEEIYTAAKGALKFPTPPAPPRMNQSDYWSPCRWCYTEGDGAWRCPVPVPRFNVPAERPNCIRNDGLCPDGHRLCAGCDRLSPLDSPSSTTCGICGEGFCGEAASACDCPPVSRARPSNQYNGLSYLLEDCSTDMLAMAFRDNWTEMCALGGYLAANPNSPTTEDIFRAILTWLRTPEGKDSGGVLGLMTRAEINLRLRVGAANDMQNAILPAEEGAVEHRMCAGCADDILCAGILEWWTRELQKPEVAAKLPAHLQGRANCKYGFKCKRQDNDRHSRKYNHICQPLPPAEAEQLVQDDSSPDPNPASSQITSAPAASSSAPSEPESDDEDEDEDDEEGDGATQDAPAASQGEPQPAPQATPQAAQPAAPVTRVDTGTQYDTTPFGLERVGRSSAIQPCWGVFPPNTGPPARTIHHSANAALASLPSTPFGGFSGSAINPSLMHPLTFGNLASPPALRLPSPQHFVSSASRASSAATSPLNAHGPWGQQHRRAGSPVLAFSHPPTSSAQAAQAQADHQAPNHQLSKYTLPFMSKSSPLHPSYGLSFPTLDPWVPGSMNNDSS